MMFLPGCLCSKEKKAAADVAEQLQGLTLQDKDAPSHHCHLTELQDLFSFSPTGVEPQECTSFSEQLQQIPAGEDRSKQSPRGCCLVPETLRAHLKVCG